MDWVMLDITEWGGWGYEKDVYLCQSFLHRYGHKNYTRTLATENSTVLNVGEITETSNSTSSTNNTTMSFTNNTIPPIDNTTNNSTLNNDKGLISIPEPNARNFPSDGENKT